MRLYTMPDGLTVDLDSVIMVGESYINKNYPEYNCYEVYMSNGTSFGVFENDMTRASFVNTVETYIS